MNKIFLLSVFSLTTLFSVAQRVDSVQLQIYYTDHIVNKPVTRPDGHSDLAVLNIGRKSSSFYSQWEDVVEQERDSLLAKGATFGELVAAQEKHPRSNEWSRVFKHYPQDESLSYYDYLGSVRYLYEERMEKPAWKVAAEKQKILGYECQKAQASFRGRFWTVWFTTEIPISDGPWKLWGLPGLILSACDSTAQYSFTCVEIKKTGKPEAIKLPAKKLFKCTREKYIEMERLSCLDPDEYQFRTTGFRSKGFEADGKPMLRKREYNPIELSEKK